MFLNKLVMLFMIAVLLACDTFLLGSMELILAMYCIVFVPPPTTPLISISYKRRIFSGEFLFIPDITCLKLYVLVS